MSYVDRIFFFLESFLQLIEFQCQTNYSILYLQEKMNPENESHKRKMCFDASYMWLLLTHGIGFKEEDFKRISFANQFLERKVGWTLGYMINQTNYIPAEHREKILPRNQFTIYLSIAMIFISMTILFLLFTGYFFCRRRSTVVFQKKKNDLKANEHELA